MKPSPSSRESLLEAAIAYHKAGYRPVWLHAKLHDGSCTCGEPACSAPGKHPRFHDWPARAATATVKDIQEWANRFPTSHLGLLTGTHPGVTNPIAVIDVDTREVQGQTGVDRWDEWAETHRLPPDVPCQITPSKGRHYIFAANGPIPTLANIMPGIDIRGDKNGQIVVWPTSGYFWDTELIGGVMYEFPRSLLPGEPAKQATPDIPPDALTIPLDRRLARAAKWAAKVPQAIAGSGGHAQTWSLAVGLVRGFALSPSDAWPIAVDYNIRCKPPWSDKELRHKLDDAATKSDKPWGYKLLSDIPHKADPVPAPAPMAWNERLTHTKSGSIEKTSANLLLILANRTSASYCEFSHRVWLLSPCDAFRTGEFPRMWSDAEDVGFSRFLADDYLVNVSPATIASVMPGVRLERNHHPVRDYLNSLHWDGIERLPHWLHMAFGAAPSTYIREAGTRFLISAVARVQEPGCQADSMLVIKGGQGIGKSRLFRELFGWFSDQLANITTKDASDNLAGVWCLELSELEAVRGHAVTSIRAFISRSTDHYRKAYGHHTGDYPRQCVFVGTTNEDQYLSDHAGARRTWAVSALHADRAWVAANRDQLWAEAQARYARGEQWHILDPTALQEAAEAAEEAYAADAWEPVVIRYMASHEGATTTEILCDGLAIELGRITRSDQTRIGTILHRCGYRARRATDGARRYYRSRP